MTMPPPLAAGCRLAPVGARKTPGEVGCTRPLPHRAWGSSWALAFSSPEDNGSVAVFTSSNLPSYFPL